MAKLYYKCPKCGNNVYTAFTGYGVKQGFKFAFKATASLAAEVVTAGRMHAGHLTAHAIDNMFGKEKSISLKCPHCGHEWRQEIDK
jgi:predicted RNA-binding Zn-ribbon protein involved in translation (DUF1610 family)